MKILQTILWILFEALMLAGAGISLWRTIKFWYIGKGGMDNFGVHVRRLTDIGMQYNTAVKMVTFKRRCAKIDSISYAAITFVFIYIFVDVIFRHIL